ISKRDINETRYNKSDLAKIWPLALMKEGDRVILKSGQFEIIAVGEVRELEGAIYHHSDCFSDVDGWDVQHYVNVEWRAMSHRFTKRFLTRSTLQQCTKPEVIRFIEAKWP